jgi:hypothetical protein
MNFRETSRCHLRTWLLALLVAFIIGAGSTLDAAAEEVTTHHISVTHHEFEAWSFVPKPGDRIAITNHSDISHSLYITYPDGTVVNLDVQLPGATVYWTVPEGEADYLFQCWIHPIIRATLKVNAIEASTTEGK